MKSVEMLLWRAFAAALILGTLAASPVAAKSLAVVELFTSQGCNSCPPADELLGELADRDDVLALSFNVDYWDYIGWKDTLASPENTARQKSYAHAMRSNRIYTPQMVIGGRRHVVGSRRHAVLQAITDEQTQYPAPVGIQLAEKDGRVVVTITGPETVGDATIWLMQYSRAHKVDILRGENRGKTISYHNAVRNYSSLGMFTGRTLEIVLSKQQLIEAGEDACAIVVQAKKQGPILGAARMEW